MNQNQNTPQPSVWPGPIALLGLAFVIAVLILAVTGCTTTYHDGKPTARISSNFTGKIHVAPDGTADIDGAVNNSAIIQSYGTASAKTIGAAGTAAAATLLVP